MVLHKLINHEEDLENGEMDEMPENGGTWSPLSLTFFGRTSRAILLSGEVTPELANCIVSQLLELMAESAEEPIYIYINTPGGSITAGLAIYDAMRIVPCPIITIVMGECHSAGLFILQGGDRRAAMPNSSFFYHEPISESAVNTNIASLANAQHYHQCLVKITEILTTRSKITKTAWKKNFEGKTAFFFNAEQAKEFKMIDEIVEYSKPRPLKFK